MPTDVVVALIGLVAIVLNGAVTIVVLLIVNRLSARIDETHALVNSRTSELLSTTAALAHAEGVQAGEQAQRDRSAPAQ